jgi:ADP-ribose pyrophosphatase YjhB (NUDIX family)
VDDPTPLSDPTPEPQSVARVAARVVLVDRAGRTLLFRGGDPHRPEIGTWWFTPGGGVEEGESLVEAARREVFEETGIELTDVGDPLLRREVRFTFEGVVSLAWTCPASDPWTSRAGPTSSAEASSSSAGGPSPSSVRRARPSTRRTCRSCSRRRRGREARRRRSLRVAYAR